MGKFITEARTRQLEVLQKGLNVEETAVAFYTQNLDQANFWKFLPENSANLIKTRLSILAAESKGHIDLVGKIISLFKELP